MAPGDTAQLSTFWPSHLGGPTIPTSQFPPCKTGLRCTTQGAEDGKQEAGYPCGWHHKLVTLLSLSPVKRTLPPAPRAPLNFPDLQQPSTKVSFEGVGLLGVPSARWFYTHLSDSVAKADSPTPWWQRPHQSGHGFSHWGAGPEKPFNKLEGREGGGGRKHLGGGVEGQIPGSSKDTHRQQTRRE